MTLNSIVNAHGNAIYICPILIISEINMNQCDILIFQYFLLLHL